MSDQPFSFKSQFKAGKTIKPHNGPAGQGDHAANYLTAEEKLAVSPPLTKEGEKSSSLMVPKGGAKKSTSKGKSSGGISPK